MQYAYERDGKYEFLETGTETKEPLMLLHGLFGGLSNFGEVITHFSPHYNVVMPTLPMFDLPLRKVSLSGLVDHLADFIEYKGYERVHILGNSLGGHVAILYALAHQEKLATITLTGSSGLFESAMGNTFPKRNNYEFIKQKTESTFYRPEVATKELVDEVFNTVTDRNKGLRVIMTAKSAVRHNLGDKLHLIQRPTLLIWGNQDTITPPFVGEKFNELIEDSELHFIDECAHAPMMEEPEQFNAILEQFLNKQ
ncbi:alpha/beta hydrolase [Lewinellaceae bacterium SD302]|nr:alpha/beta hydrolase [Lewinellaceae bacterium SD302]